LALGQQLGLLDEDNNATNLAKVWHVIGAIHIPTGETTTVDGMETVLTTPKVDADGNQYWHANLTTDFDLLDYSTTISDPTVQAAIAARGSYFMPLSPNNPVCVRAGMQY
jgi:hypothetical protein